MTTTINENEILHFQGVSNNWWDSEDIANALYALNTVRIPFFLDRIISTGAIKKEYLDSSTPLKDLLILDVGCGVGFLSEELAKLGATVMGIDPCTNLLHQAKHHATLDPSLGNLLDYKAETIEEHVLQNREKYDVVIASEVLDHVNEQEMFLKYCAKCLKPGGSIFVTTINQTIVAWFLVVICAEYILGIVAKGSHHYRQFISPEETQKILKSYRCHTKSVSGWFYNVFTGNWFKIPFTTIFYGVHAIKY